MHLVAKSLMTFAMVEARLLQVLSSDEGVVVQGTVVEGNGLGYRPSFEEKPMARVGNVGTGVRKSKVYSVKGQVQSLSTKACTHYSFTRQTTPRTG